MSNWQKHLKNDIPASIVVFLVALPLCMGIALASNAPLISGIVAGIIGGVVVGFISNSSLSVSGPAAGLTAVVVNSLDRLPSYEIFLVAVIIAGVLQLVLGFLKAGSVVEHIPLPVIKGMLAAIGIILILKQIPYALGYTCEGESSLNIIWSAVKSFSSLGAAIITLVTIVLMFLWELKPLKNKLAFKIIPAPLVAVVSAILINQYWFAHLGSSFVLNEKQLANIPLTGSFNLFIDELSFPDFTGITSSAVLLSSITIAIIASVESLLSVEAVDKIDPNNKVTDKNRELKAQGLGNIVSGLLGGLPITSVIARSSANINAGGKTKLTTILHGLLLLFCVVFITPLLNLIPLSALAGILIYVGYTLVSPKTIKAIAKSGYVQLIPFFITIIAILLSNLLVGIVVGLLVSLFIKRFLQR